MSCIRNSGPDYIFYNILRDIISDNIPGSWAMIIFLESSKVFIKCSKVFTLCSKSIISIIRSDIITYNTLADTSCCVLALTAFGLYRTQPSISQGIIVLYYTFITMILYRFLLSIEPFVSWIWNCLNCFDTLQYIVLLLSSKWFYT